MERTSLAEDALLVGFLVLIEFLVREIAINGGRIGDSELVKAHLTAGIGASDRSRDLIGVPTFSRDAAVRRARSTLKVLLRRRVIPKRLKYQ